MSGATTTSSERLAVNLSRRKHFRLECTIRATFEAPSAGARGDLIVRNIGLGGARIDAPVEFPMPCNIALKLPPQDTLADPQPELELECQVAWTVADRAEGPYPTGIQFGALDENMRRRLFRYLAAVMA